MVLIFIMYFYITHNSPTFFTIDTAGTVRVRLQLKSQISIPKNIVIYLVHLYICNCLKNLNSSIMMLMEGCIQVVFNLIITFPLLTI